MKKGQKKPDISDMEGKREGKDVFTTCEKMHVGRK